jgi:hypothetical protein
VGRGLKTDGLIGSPAESDLLLGIQQRDLTEGLNQKKSRKKAGSEVNLLQEYILIYILLRLPGNGRSPQASEGFLSYGSSPYDR